ncbi:unnamed protein product [Dovyalis caffra]|uniref:Uncharacterized protein n=1 Tax=Dovyalis caffra TaxID=77055 RepID=A0AAV1SJK4_9ROSI|nr:unnamed protein product [Dovyalis caffra]
MAVLFLNPYDNKENIPLVVTKSESPLLTSNKRRVRRPLEDITNLLNQEIYSSSVLDNRIRLLQPLPLGKVKCGKRRAEDGSESRLLDPSVVRRNLIRTIRALGESEVYNVEQGNESMISGQRENKRVIPGGPDGQHH